MTTYALIPLDVFFLSRPMSTRLLRRLRLELATPSGGARSNLKQRALLQTIVDAIWIAQIPGGTGIDNSERWHLMSSLGGYLERSRRETLEEVRDISHLRWSAC